MARYSKQSQEKTDFLEKAEKVGKKAWHKAKETAEWGREQISGTGVENEAGDQVDSKQHERRGSTECKNKGPDQIEMRANLDISPLLQNPVYPPRKVLVIAHNYSPRGT